MQLVIILKNYLQIILMNNNRNMPHQCNHHQDHIAQANIKNNNSSIQSQTGKPTACDGSSIFPAVKKNRLMAIMIIITAASRLKTAKLKF